MSAKIIKLFDIEPDRADILELLVQSGLPVTRDNFIGINWSPVPEEWPAEHEEQLPPWLREWTPEADDGDSAEIIHFTRR